MCVGFPIILIPNLNSPLDLKLPGINFKPQHLPGFLAEIFNVKEPLNLT